jgi:DHA1 family bicyclomycin/chloramphenicol resistance-like MFS transporter
MAEHNDMSISSDHRQPEKRDDYRFLNLTLYFLFAVGPLVGNAVLVLLGAISTQFAINPTSVLSAIPAFMFPFAVFQLFSGAISDSYGRVPVIAGGLIIFAVGLFMTAYAATLEIFIMGNVVTGIGFGFVNPVLLALLTDTARPPDIPKRMGIAAALASLSVGLGPFIAGQMVVLGWQSYYLMFLIIVVFGLLAVTAAKRPPMISERRTGLSSFITHLERELKRPIVLLILVTTFLVALSYLGVFVWTSRGLSGVVNDGVIGLLLLGGGVSGGAAGSLLGSLTRRYGFRPIVIIGLTVASPIPIVGLALVSTGWAGGILFPTMITYSQIVSPEHRGVLAGVVTFSFFIGSALIPIIFEPLFLMGLQLVYIAMSLVSVILVFFFIVLLRTIKTID